MTLPDRSPPGLPELNLSEVRTRLATARRPYVTLKAGTSLDGRIAMASGEARWITGEAARALGHELRACHDAVLVGVGTALADDPALTARLPDGERRPIRVVLDSRCRTPPGAAVWAEDGARRIAAVGSEAPAGPVAALEARGVEILSCATPRPELSAVLPALRERGVELLLVEGGAAVHAAFIANAAADAVFLFVAGRLIGDPAAPAWCGPLGIARLADTPRLALSPPRLVGADVLLHGRFLPVPAE